MKRLDLTGLRFGRLLVLKHAGVKDGNSFYKCLCRCGKITFVLGNNLTRGLTSNCGCKRSEMGFKRTSSWVGPKSPAWKGGKVSLKNKKRQAVRNKAKVAQWSKKVYKRDKYTCQICFASKLKIKN